MWLDSVALRLFAFVFQNVRHKGQCMLGDVRLLLSLTLVVVVVVKCRLLTSSWAERT